MSRLVKLLAKLEASPNHVRFSDLCKICDRFFGQARQHGTSHRIYKTPWADDPRINIQDHGGMAKAYQVRQVLAAVRRMRGDDDP